MNFDTIARPSLYFSKTFSATVIGLKNRDTSGWHFKCVQHRVYQGTLSCRRQHALLRRRDLIYIRAEGLALYDSVCSRRKRGRRADSRDQFRKSPGYLRGEALPMQSQIRRFSLAQLDLLALTISIMSSVRTTGSHSWNDGLQNEVLIRQISL